VVQPTCPSWLKQNSFKDQLAAGLLAAKQKHHDHDEWCHKEDSKLVACVAEATGAWVPEAIELFKQLTITDEQSCPLSRKELFETLISQLAVAIQQGNHKIVIRVHSMIRARGLSANVLRPIIDLTDSAPPTPERTPVHTPVHTPLHTSSRAQEHTPAHSSASTPVHTPLSAASQQRVLSASAVQLQSDGFGIVDSQGTPLQQREPEFNPDDVIVDGSVLLPAQRAQSVQVQLPASPSADFGAILDQSADDQQLVFPEQDLTAENDSDSDYLPDESEVRSSRNLIGREPARRTAKGRARRPAANRQ
jgi:hypothetical protein